MLLDRLRPVDDDPPERLPLLRFTDPPVDRFPLLLLPTDPLLPRLDEPDRFTVPRFVVRPVDLVWTPLLDVERFRVLRPLLTLAERALALIAERLLETSGLFRLMDDRPDEASPVLLGLYDRFVIVLLL